MLAREGKGRVIALARGRFEGGMIARLIDADSDSKVEAGWVDWRIGGFQIVWR